MTSAATVGEITRLLDAWEKGDPRALDQVLPLAFEDLRRIARKCSGRIPCRDLQPTELIGEIYATLRRQRNVHFEGRGQFYKFAAMLMDRVLLDFRRQLSATKRGGQTVQVSLADALDMAVANSTAVPADPASRSGRRRFDPEEALQAIGLAVDVAQKLAELAELDAQQADVARLRYFLGLTISQTAEALSISVTTVNRKWRNAKRFLGLELDEYDGRRTG